MLVLRCTKKLRDRFRAAPTADTTDVSTTVLGDWFANALFWRPQVALLVNTRTLLPVFMPLAPATNLVTRVPDTIARHLRRQGASEEFIAAELEQMREVRVAPTNSRSVLGVMNEFAFQGEWARQLDQIDDLDEMSHRLAGLIVGPLMGGNGSPDRELAAILGTDRSNVIPFRAPLPAAPTGPGAAAHGGPAADTAAGAPPRRSKPHATRAYRLKISLRGITPPIWRRVIVDGATTLDELHEVIQAAFGWWNYHLYEFEIGSSSYGIPDPDWDFGPPMREARRVRLDRVAAAGDTFTYTYDFGDNWVHRVEVERVDDAAPGTPLPTCVGGRRAAPPEDCGGSWGYEHLLRVLADPTDSEHEHLSSWAADWHGRDDPNAFDPSEFDDNLRLVRAAIFED